MLRYGVGLSPVRDVFAQQGQDRADPFGPEQLARVDSRSRILARHEAADRAARERTAHELTGKPLAARSSQQDLPGDPHAMHSHSIG